MGPTKACLWNERSRFGWTVVHLERLPGVAHDHVIDSGTGAEEPDHLRGDVADLAAAGAQVEDGVSVAHVRRRIAAAVATQTSPRRHRVQQLARALPDESLHDAICVNVEAVLLHAGENHAADIVGRRAPL
jgi:hypothetical protein